MIFETHAHYDDEEFDQDREELVSSLPEKGIKYAANIGSNIETSQSTLELTKKYSHIYGVVGVHPNETGELNEDTFALLKKMAEEPKIVAIGEIGLDYHWKEPEPQIQKEWFDRQMSLAKELKLPIVIHSRDAAKDTIDMMNGAGAKEIGGVVHCYSYSLETAKIFLNMGFYLGIGGVVTFKNARKLKEVVEYVPLDRILLETDCPYLAPEPFRGKRNSSLNIPYIVKEIARIKNIDYETITAVTMENGKAMYKIS